MDGAKRTEKLLKGHDRQLKLSKKLAKVGFNSPLGKRLRMQAYYPEGLTLFKAWRDFLDIRQNHIGNTFWAFDHALMHTGYDDVKKLMQVEPQRRGEDIGIIKVLTPSYMLNQPMSLWTQGDDHAHIRALLQETLPDPFEQAAELGQFVDIFLSEAAQRGRLHIGKDLPRLMLTILHQLVLGLSLSDKAVKASLFYLFALPLTTLPSFLNRSLLALLIGPRIRHRRRLITHYQTSPKWTAYVEKGEQSGLSPDQVANALFDMIHLAGTLGTSALMGSVIGMLCLDEDLRAQVEAEVSRVWPETDALTGEHLRQARVLHSVILETARLYPPVRFIAQRSAEAGEVDIGGQKCPFYVGTRLLGSVFNANRDARKYDHPNTFSLDRDFSDLLSWHGANRDRVCPGRSLSIELIKVVCMSLLKNYQWERATAVEWNFELAVFMTPNKLELLGFSVKS